MDLEKLDELFYSDYNQPVNVDRRQFLKKLGGGIMVAFFVGKLSLMEAFGSNPSEDLLNFNAYLKVKEDGRISCFTGKIEMGQGVSTSLAQVVADELNIPITSIDMIMGDTELCPYDAGTWGSLTTRFTDPVLREAAAELREILKSLASKVLDTSIENLETKNGEIFVKNNPSKKVSYAYLTKNNNLVETLKIKPRIKKSSEFSLIGKPVRNIDAEDKVTGKAMYAGDIKLSNMVHATIIRPDVYGSKRISVDASKLKDFKGAELIEIKKLIAVVHKDPEISRKASKKIKVTWEEPELNVNNETIFNYLKDTIKDSKVFQNKGDLEVGEKNAEFVISANYEDGYVAHAPIETHTTTCSFKNEKLIIWTSCQTPFGIRSKLAKSLKISEEDVHVKQILLGGGFGGKISNNQATEAALISKSCGKPVQLVWSRKEEFMYDKFRPAALMKVTSGADKNGKLTLWNFDIYCAGTRGTKLFYEVENNRTRMFNKSGVHPFGVGPWRAPGNNSTTFARESHIDVTAHKLNIDPLEFRLNNLSNKYLYETLKLGAKTFGWDRPKKEGHGYGIALGEDAGTCVAMLAEVHVDKSTGVVTPIKVVCAQDMGQVVNPLGATVQTEGGITMGLGYALYEDLEFEGGKIKTKSFNNYTITKFSTTPKIECVFIDKMDSKPQGGGEPAIICMGGVIANAVFDACGTRVKRMPITPERILKEM